MWKEAPPTRKKEVLSSHLVESSHRSLTTASPSKIVDRNNRTVGEVTRRNADEVTRRNLG